MNQEQNNLNPNNFNTQGNNEIPNNQPLNNQMINNNIYQNQVVQQSANVNQPIFNPEPQPTPSFQQPINQMNVPLQSMNNTFENGNASSQNLNSKPPKKMNLGLIIGIVAVVSVVIVGIVLVPKLFNKSNNSNGSQNNSLYGDTELGTEDFFIFEFSKIKDDYWNKINDNSIINQTNKEVLNNNISSDIGDVWGPLAVKTTGFTENIQIGSNYYTLNLKNNDFLFINSIPLLNDHVSKASSTINAFVIGKDLKSYNINISIENKKISTQMELNKWITNITDTNDIYSVTAYYKIDDTYYLKVDIPDYFSDEFLEKNTSQKRENYPYTKKDVDNLMDKVLSLISLTKGQGELDTSYFTVNKENYKFKNGISMDFNSMKFETWNSGDKDARYSMLLAQPCLSIDRENYKRVFMYQWNGKNSYDKYLNTNNYLLKDYEYKGKKFYIEYFSDETEYEELRGKYVGISFQDGDYYYSISSIGYKDLDPNTLDINNWFKNLTDELLIFE